MTGPTSTSCTVSTVLAEAVLACAARQVESLHADVEALRCELQRTDASFARLDELLRGDRDDASGVHGDADSIRSAVGALERDLRRSARAAARARETIDDLEERYRRARAALAPATERVADVHRLTRAIEALGETRARVASLCASRP